MTKRLKTRSWHQIPSSLFWALGISCRDNFSQLQLSWMTGVIPAYNLTSSSGSHGLHLTIQYTVNTLNTLYTHTKSTTLLPTSLAGSTGLCDGFFQEVRIRPRGNISISLVVMRVHSVFAKIVRDFIRKACRWGSTVHLYHFFRCSSPITSNRGWC